MTRLALMAAVALLSVPAQAAEAVIFTVHDTGLTVPLPAGYCLPRDRDKAIADLLAEGDTQNVTLATLIRCDMADRAEGLGHEYMLIKAPKQTLAVRVSRPDLLSALGAEFGKPEWQSGASSEQANQNAAKDVSDALKTPVAIEGDLAPRGTDADCAYLGGTLQISGAGISYPINLGSCITSAGEKIVSVHAYDDPGRSGGVAGLMRKARDVALSIRAAP